MARDLEYLTGMRGVRYPFADDSTLPTGDAESLLVFGCFVDAMVQLKPGCENSAPLVGNLSISGKTLSFSLKGPATTALTCTRSPAVRFPVVKGETDWCWYVFVLSSDGIKAYGENAEAVGDVSSAWLGLADRCVGRPTAGVTSVWVYGGTASDSEGRRYTLSEALDSAPDVVVRGDVKLQAGYNMAFSAGADYLNPLGTAENDRITLNAVPGAGMGTLPCGCESADAVFKTPGLLSSDGHVRLFNDTCYDLVPGKISGTKAELRIHAKCKACCTCEMYAGIVKDKLVPLRDSILASRKSLDDTLAVYEENVAKWNDRLATVKPEDIMITAMAVPLDAAATDLNGGDGGTMNRCGISLTVRNDSFQTIKVRLSDFLSNGDPFEAQVSFMNSKGEPKIIQPTVVNVRDLDGDSPGDTEIVTLSLPPGKSFAFTCFVRLRDFVRTDRQNGFMTSVKVTAFQGDRVILTRTKDINV